MARDLVTPLYWIFVKYGLIFYFFKVFSGIEGIMKIDNIMKLLILICVTGKCLFTNIKYQYHLDEIGFTSLRTLNI